MRGLLAGFSIAALLPSIAKAHAQENHFTITPYGTVTLNGVYDDVKTTSADVPYLVAPAGSGSLVLTARQSRAGVSAGYTFPDLSWAKQVGGDAEIDFYGGSIGQGLASYFPLPRLRLAYAYLSFGSIRVVAGQDWVIFAPLNPESALHFAVAGFATAGNLWAREPQIRLEGSHVRGHWGVAWAAGVFDDAETSPNATDQTTVSSVKTAQPGELSELPAVEARVALLRDVLGRQGALGLSGQAGLRRWSLPSGTVDTDSWGAALDLTLPLGSMVTLEAEGFTGEDLAAFMGGVNQGVAVATVNGVITAVDGIHSKGGWAQVIFRPSGKWTLALGPGIDSPSAADHPATTENLAVYAMVAFEIVRGFTATAEYNYLRTSYADGTSPAATVAALSVQYTF